jgi:hypothetical protein
VLKIVFGPKSEEGTGCWRKLYIEDLHNLYTSPNIIRLIKLRILRREGHVARIGAIRKSCRILVVKPVGKRPLRRPRYE